MAGTIVARSLSRYGYQRVLGLSQKRAIQQGVLTSSQLLSVIQASSFSTTNDELDAGLNKRIQHIHMHPKSVGSLIFPGDYVLKKDEKSGKQRKIITDRAYGYFWMMKDLEETESKPILSNKNLISQEEAQPFPPLKNLTSLSGETVDIPEYFIRNNRANDATAQCTLVTISFKDHGFKLLPSWTDPFEEAFGNSDESNGRRAAVMRISITEGWFMKMIRGLVTNGFKKNTPLEQYDVTLLSFGAELDEFKDILRMHNTMTGYVYLLDGLGRVRWAGSGKATPEEVELLVSYAQELTPLLKKDSPERKKQERGRKVLSTKRVD